MWIVWIVVDGNTIISVYQCTSREQNTHRHLCILCCGGDGTVAWVLKTIRDLQLEPAPHVAVCPLGTGNDLSLSFGWGGEYKKYGGGRGKGCDGGGGGLSMQTVHGNACDRLHILVMHPPHTTILRPPTLPSCVHPTLSPPADRGLMGTRTFTRHLHASAPLVALTLTVGV